VEAIAESFVYGLILYFLIGGAVAILFLTFFVSRLDEAARGARLFFRPVIFIGCATLWPLVVIRILVGKKMNAPIEENE